MFAVPSNMLFELNEDKRKLCIFRFLLSFIAQKSTELFDCSYAGEAIVALAATAAAAGLPNSSFKIHPILVLCIREYIVGLWTRTTITVIKVSPYYLPDG